nr:MAG TPA: hypothetical protein [Caudoviricetes sp.]
MELYILVCTKTKKDCSKTRKTGCLLSKQFE